MPQGWMRSSPMLRTFTSLHLRCVCLCGRQCQHGQTRAAAADHPCWQQVISRHAVYLEIQKSRHLGGVIGGGAEDGLEHRACLHGRTHRHPAPHVGCATAAGLVFRARGAQPRHDVRDLVTVRRKPSSCRSTVCIP